MCERQLRFSYEMNSDFDHEITRHDFRLLCIPRQDERQRVKDLQIQVSPCAWRSCGTDGFGNTFVYGTAHDPHRYFSVQVSGLAEIGAFPENSRENVPVEAFLVPTPLTAPGTHLTRYFQAILSSAGIAALPYDSKGSLFDSVQLTGEQTFPDSGGQKEAESTGKTITTSLDQCGGETRANPQEKSVSPFTEPYRDAQDLSSGLGLAWLFMDHLQQDFAYQSGKTDTETTSEQAFRNGCGVCQDYAHLLITLCRMAGIPARYVAGMVVGEGETHAWAQVYADGKWHGLDPTYHCAVGDRYIRLSHGRDCRDCLVNKGIYFNQAKETQSVQVSVFEENDITADGGEA